MSAFLSEGSVAWVHPESDDHVRERVERFLDDGDACIPIALDFEAQHVADIWR